MKVINQTQATDYALKLRAITLELYNEGRDLDIAYKISAVIRQIEADALEGFYQARNEARQREYEERKLYKSMLSGS